jgi:hypothetical protein
MKILSVILLLLASALAQQNQSPQAETSGNCSPVFQNNTGKVDFVCDTMDKATVSKIVSLLNAILRKTSDTNDTDKKLDDILEFLKTRLPPQRTLVGPDREAFITALRPACPFEVAIRGIPGDKDSQEYAKQIGEAIQEAGCTLKRPRFLIDTGPSYGVGIVIHDIQKIPAGADALTGAFNKAHVKLTNQASDVIEVGSVYVMVGFNDFKPQ